MFEKQIFYRLKIFIFLIQNWDHQISSWHSIALLFTNTIVEFLYIFQPITAQLDKYDDKVYFDLLKAGNEKCDKSNSYFLWFNFRHFEVTHCIILYHRKTWDSDLFDNVTIMTFSQSKIFHKNKDFFIHRSQSEVKWKTIKAKWVVLSQNQVWRKKI